jgi:hypothetical protein
MVITYVDLFKRKRFSIKFYNKGLWQGVSFEDNVVDKTLG